MLPIFLSQLLHHRIKYFYNLIEEKLEQPAALYSKLGEYEALNLDILESLSW